MSIGRTSARGGTRTDQRVILDALHAARAALGVNTVHAYAEVDELLHEIGNTSATVAVKHLMALAWLKGKSAGLDDGLEAMRAVRAVRESHSVRA